jgi:hypothetical protein
MRLSCSSEFEAGTIACYRLTSVPYAVQRPWGILSPACCRSACVGPQSSLELGPPSEFDQTTTAGKTRQLSWGSALFSATESEGFTVCRELPGSPLRSAFRVSHPLDGLHPLGPTRSCFIPGALLRFSLRGISPLTSRTPLGAVAPPPLERRVLTANQGQRIRTRTSSTSKLCSRQGSVPASPGITRNSGRCPLGIPPL